MIPVCGTEPEIEILPPGNGLIHVVACPHPFEMRRVDFKVNAGSTLAEIIAIAQPEHELRRFVHVAIGEHVISREQYHRIRPRPGTRVTLRVLPGKKVIGGGGGGGGGGKNPLGIILSIVTVVAAIFLPPLLLGPGLAGTALFGGVGLTYGGLMAGGIMIAGGLLANALAPPSKPGKLAALTSASASSVDRDSPTLSLTGARNDIRVNSVLPVVLGRHWQVPPLGAPTYTEIVGSDQYLRMVVVWGIGPLEVTDRKIGDTSLSVFGDIQTEFRRGYQPNQIVERGTWYAPNGVYPTDPMFGHRWTITTAGTVGGRWYEIGDTITYNGLADPGITYSWDLNSGHPFESFPYDVAEQSEQIVLSMDYQQRTTSIDTDNISFDAVYYRGLVRFDDAGQKSSTSSAFESDYAPTGTAAWVPFVHQTSTAAQTSAVRVSGSINVPRGQYDVRWRRHTPLSTDTREINDLSVVALRSTRYEPPFDHRGGSGANRPALCCEVIRIRATDQLQGVVDNLSGICRTLAEDWNGTEWVVRETNNPASLFRLVFQGPGSAVPLPDERINLPDLQYWHQFCIENGYTFDHIVDYNSSVTQIAADIAAAARASVTTRDNKRTIVIDEPMPVPVQIFTPRNSSGYRSEIQYPDLPHGYRVQFVNNLTGKGQERIVYDDGYDGNNALIYESLPLTGVTDPTHAYKLGRYHIAVARLRRESPSLMADFESLVCTRGDMVRVSHDVPLWGLKSGRVGDVIIQGDTIAGIILDETVTMEAGKNYTIRFRRASASAMEQYAAVGVNPGEQKTILINPLPLTTLGLQTVSPGDLFWFGETGLEHRNLRVHAIVEPSADYSCRIIFVEDNTAIYSAHLAPIPPYDPGISDGASILYPRVISVRSDGTVVFRSPNGNYDNRILITYALPSGTMATAIAGVEAQYRLVGSTHWTVSQTAMIQLGEISLMEVDGHETYEIQLRFVRKDGTRGIWSPADLHTVIAQDGVPPDISYFVVSRMQDGTRRFEWRMVLEPEDVVAGGGYRIRHQQGTEFEWETAQSIFTAGLINASPYETNDIPAGTWTFGIKAVTASGIESTAARTLTVELGDPRLRTLLLQRIENIELWPGVKTDCIMWGEAPQHLQAGPGEGSRWETQGVWTTMDGVRWQDLPRASPIMYTTPSITIAGGRDFNYTPRIQVDADEVVTVEMRVRTSAQGQFFAVSDPWGPIAQVSQAAYLQVRVISDGPKIRNLIIEVDGDIAVDDIEDINTLTTTSPWFQRLGVGWFRVATRKNIGIITGASIRSVQSSGTNWTWRLVTKNASVAGNTAPAAEFLVYNSGILTDAIVDIELKGPIQ